MQRKRAMRHPQVSRSATLGEPAAQARSAGLASGLTDQALLAGIFGSAEGFNKWS
jgi:hypothetical protein